LTVVIGLALGKGVLGADDITNGGRNGRGWQSLPREMRLAWVDGYLSGANEGVVGFTIYGPAVRDTSGKPDFLWAFQQVPQVVRHLFPYGMNFGEVVSAVDRFYEEPLNRRIRVSTVLEILALEAGGADAATVDGVIRRARQPDPVRELPAAGPPGREPAK
jgi:hypothetical protein